MDEADPTGAHSREIVWDDEDRILQITDHDNVIGHSDTTNFIYNAAGQRTVKWSSLHNMRAYYPNQFVSSRITADSGTDPIQTVSTHVFVGTQRIASRVSSLHPGETTEPGDVYWSHSDHLSSTNYVTDQTGAVREHAEFFPFGDAFVEEHQGRDVLDAAAVRPDPYLWFGQERDSETGLYYLNARYYDSHVGQFLSTDPPNIGERGYAWNNPVWLSDPSGLSPLDPNKPDTAAAPNWSSQQINNYINTGSPGSSSGSSGGMDAGVDTTHTDAGAIPANSYDPLRTAVQVESAVFGAGAGALSVVSGGGTGPLEWTNEWDPYTADAQVASDIGFGFGAIAMLVRGFIRSEPLAERPAPRTDIGRNISPQRQFRHLLGRAEAARRGGGYMNSVGDAQRVLDAYHAGQTEILGTNAQGNSVVRFNGVTGTKVNVAAGYPNRPTNVFMIKGTSSVSVVPLQPNWSPRIPSGSGE